MKTLSLEVRLATAWLLAVADPRRSRSRASALDLQLKGKTALVTGSTSNIGYATAEALLKEGADVIINARSQESVDKAAASLKATTGRTPKSFVGRHGQGRRHGAPREGVPERRHPREQRRHVHGEGVREDHGPGLGDHLQVNVLSGVRLSRAYLPRMKQQNWGRIIFISSESALQIPVESIHYGDDEGGADRAWRAASPRNARRPASP